MPMFFYKQTLVDTWPTEHLSLLVKQLHKERIRNAGLPAILLAGVEDRNGTQNLVELEWAQVVLNLRGETQVNIHLYTEFKSSVWDHYTVSIGFLWLHISFTFIPVPPAVTWCVNRTKSRSQGGGFYSPDDNMLARSQTQTAFQDWRLAALS